MARGRKLPSPDTRINVRVFSADWDWLNERHPGRANEVLRDLLAAYVRHQKAKSSQ